MNQNSKDFFQELKSEFQDIGTKVNKVFDELVKGKGGMKAGATTGNVQADVYEHAEGLSVELDLPGYRKDEVSIQIQENILVVKGSRTRATEAKRFHVQERRFEAFERSFTLPAGVITAQIKARFDNGVLCISLPMEANAVEEHEIRID